jgi:flagellar biosynthesis protein FliR
MPLNIAVGFMVLGFSLMVFMHTLTNAFAALPRQITAVFRILGG